ncbi:HpcH/HpaI aldolase/citrate lyase family protein [Mesoplasma lactucae]|uniref:Citrate lyase subunit beta n=1 Tax=Mesoplasma lactucae ATCC 49193 TaxID=81460 RepID=A0A291ISS1_9MOLU|nr:aldolase/citrate lyase family protein [Mesoplasma lactucae]ATG97746.1 citrate lyase subunit beta [Mesoplasma lactucae ATCC 49193]ATZ20477.1 citrate lyase subunit beta [Mesoplasma lactucae ATCC 49193]MCL8216649.1 Citrate lyase subunit beta [Mesoplasma lactucae ATCC 49193]
MNGWKRTTPRKSMLFVPANKPANFRDLPIYKPDTVMFDLEDAISFSEKDATRILLREMLKEIDYNDYGIEVCVRINGIDTPWYEQDIAAVIEGGVDMIRLPKTESADDVLKTVALLEKYEKQFNKGKTLIAAAIESAQGVLKAEEIVAASDRVQVLALGGADYLVDLHGSKIPPHRTELLYGRQHLIHVARAAKIDVFDVIYGNTADEEGFKEDVKYSFALGFSGKSCIHPNQVRLINDVIRPTADEVEYAVAMVNAFNDSVKKGLGVFLFRGTMVDKPIVEKQQEVVALAKEFNMLKGDEINE